jgi:hypothetical protein
MVEMLRAPKPTIGRKPSPILSALGRILDRMNRYEGDLIRTDAMVYRFRLTPNEWALYSGITVDTARAHLKRIYERLATSAPAGTRRTGG